MGLALHCRGERKLTNGEMEEERDTKRKKGWFPQALIDLQALPKSVFMFPTAKNSFHSSNQEETGQNCDVNISGVLPCVTVAQRWPVLECSRLSDLLSLDPV